MHIGLRIGDLNARFLERIVDRERQCLNDQSETLASRPAIQNELQRALTKRFQCGSWSRAGGYFRLIARDGFENIDHATRIRTDGNRHANCDSSEPV